MYVGLPAAFVTSIRARRMNDPLSESERGRRADAVPRMLGGVAAVAPLVPVVFTVMLARAMSKPLDHDEHQFIASGALLARRGLLPYRDYPYFHMPYLAGAYALLFRLSP